MIIFSRLVIIRKWSLKHRQNPCSTLAEYCKESGLKDTYNVLTSVANAGCCPLPLLWWLRIFLVTLVLLINLKNVIAWSRSYFCSIMNGVLHPENPFLLLENVLSIPLLMLMEVMIHHHYCTYTATPPSFLILNNLSQLSVAQKCGWRWCNKNHLTQFRIFLKGAVIVVTPPLRLPSTRWYVILTELCYV